MRKGSSTAVQEAVSRYNSLMKGPVITTATDERFKIKRVPIGILTLERITGGGFVRGRHVELFGDAGACKSYTMYLTMVLAQQRGEMCALVDSEHIFDRSWFEHLGGNAKDLILYWPETADELIQVLMLFAQQHPDVQGVSIAGIDSVASLLPREELLHDISDGKDDRMASRARLMSRLLRRVTALNRDTLFIWTNQTTEKIGSFIPGRTTPGGRSLGFYATTRIEMVKGKKVKAAREVAREGALTKKDIAVGNWVQVRAEKEKSTRPYQEGMFFFDTEEGCVDRATEIIHLGLEDGIVEQVKRGNQTAYAYDDFTGTLKQWRQMLVDDPSAMDDVVDFIQQNTRILAGE